MIEQVQEVVPTHRVKRFLDVELEQESRGVVVAIQASSKVAHVHEIIMNTYLFDESTRDKVIHEGC